MNIWIKNIFNCFLERLEEMGFMKNSLELPRKDPAFMIKSYLVHKTQAAWSILSFDTKGRLGGNLCDFSFSI